MGGFVVKIEPHFTSCKLLEGFGHFVTFRHNRTRRYLRTNTLSKAAGGSSSGA